MLEIVLLYLYPCVDFTSHATSFRLHSIARCHTYSKRWTSFIFFPVGQLTLLVDVIDVSWRKRGAGKAPRRLVVKTRERPGKKRPEFYILVLQ